MKEKFKEIIQLGKINRNEDETQTKNNWLDKLKPCPKNSIVKDKIFNSIYASNSNFSKEIDLNKKTNKLKENSTGNVKFNF